MAPGGGSIWPPSNGSSVSIIHASRRSRSFVEEASWDAFFEHSGIKPVLILYENFEGDYETSTLRLLKRLDLSPPEGFTFEPRIKRQSDGLNDDWARRYSELRLGTDFDLVPAVPDSAQR